MKSSRCIAKIAVPAHKASESQSRAQMRTEEGVGVPVGSVLLDSKDNTRVSPTFSRSHPDVTQLEDGHDEGNGEAPISD